MDITRTPDDIVQLIPADGWCAIYAHDGEEVAWPVVAFGLRRDGSVRALDMAMDGEIDEVYPDPGHLLRMERAQHAPWASIAKESTP